jgi:hypothetical protein
MNRVATDLPAHLKPGMGVTIGCGGCAGSAP